MRPLVDAIRHQVPSVQHFILLDDAVEPSAGAIPADASEGYIGYESLLAGASPYFEPPSIEDDALMGLFYTSGTTGEPKGVMLTHRNMESNNEHSMAVYQYRPDDSYLHVAPMFHLADGAAIFIHTAGGRSQVVIPRFDPALVLDTIQRERVNLILLVPTMINFILQHPELGNYDLSSLRHVTYGASPIAPESAANSDRGTV
jgi:long-chain acyl-CoA synthetase